jgi:large subunit ribosomal protein L25
VPITLKGEPKGVKQQGGLLDFVTRDIQVLCLPTEIPEHIDIDVAEMMLNQSIRVRDLAPDAKWKAVTSPDTMIVHVVMPKAEESAQAAVGEAVPTTGEPEVIKKGKGDEDKEKEKEKK